MRKLLSLVLAFLMVFSTFAMCVVPTFASSEPEGTGNPSYLPDGLPEGAKAITNETEFAGMEPDGIYYLASDLTLSSSYDTFKGTLYGMGKTITINNDSLMVFNVLDGAKVYGLTIKGSTTAGETVGALAKATTNDVYVCEVVNEATVKATAKAAGLIATASGTTTLEDCANNGRVTVTAANGCAGGLIAYGTGNLTVKNSTSTRQLTAESTGSTVGGIVGKMAAADDSCQVKFENCVVSSRITATAESGGIAGSLTGTYGKVEATNCTVKGFVEATSDAGGIIGYVEKAQTLNVDSCVVYASVSGANSGTGGILGSFVSISAENGTATITSCIVTGAVSGTDCCTGGIFGYVDNQVVANYTFEVSGCTVLSSGISGNSTTTDRVGGLGGHLNLNNTNALKKLALTGNVVMTNVSGSGEMQVAGILGRMGKHKGTAEISNNLFIGSVVADTHAGGITGDTYVGSGQVVVYENNAIYADITSREGAAVALSASGNLTSKESVQSNVFVGTLTGATKTVLAYNGGSKTGQVPALKNYWLRTEESYNAGTFYVWSKKDDTAHTPISDYDSKYALASNEKSEAVLTDLGENWTYVTGAALPNSTTETFTGYIPVSAKAAFDKAAAFEYNNDFQEDTGDDDISGGGSEDDEEYDGEYTEIKTAEEFLAMDPYGYYKLANDITLNTTYPYVFFGGFDGGDHSINTTVPVFEKLEGVTISNLTINGSISATAPNVGALANIAATVRLNKVTNKADVTNSIQLVKKDDHSRTTAGLIGTASGKVTLNACRNDGVITGAMAGGLIGLAKKGVTFTATDCVNSGMITNYTGKASVGGGILACGENGSYELSACVNTGGVLFATAEEAYAGGIIGTIWEATVSSFTMSDCRNSGMIVSPYEAGGIAGFINADLNATFAGCKNAGKIISSKTIAGGIVGNIGKSSTNAVTHTFTDCVNIGDVYAHYDCVGGILGKSLANVTATRCINSGNVSVDNRYTDVDSFVAGGIVGYVIAVADVQYCVNTGNVEGLTRAAGILAHSGSKTYGSTGFVISYCVNTGNVYTSRGGDNAGAAGIVAYLYGGSPIVTNNTVAGSVKSDVGTANGIIVQCNGGGADYRYNAVLLGENDVAGSATYLIGAKVANTYDANTEKVLNTYGKKDVFDYLFSRSVDSNPAPVEIPADRCFESASEFLTGEKQLADFVLEDTLIMHKDVVEVYKLRNVTADSFIPEDALPEVPEETTPVVPDTSVTEPDTSVTEPDGTESTTEPDDETTKPTDTTTKPSDEVTTGSTDSGKKKGCGSVVGGAIAIAALALITPAVVVLKKDEE